MPKTLYKLLYPAPEEEETGDDVSSEVPMKEVIIDGEPQMVRATEGRCKGQL